VLQKTFKQANLLFHAEAWKVVRQVNDQVKSQVKHNPGLAVIFQQVLETFASFAPPGGGAASEPPPEPEPESQAPPAA